MVSWGIVTVCTAAVSSYTGLIVCRIMLGVAEAGFFRKSPFTTFVKQLETDRSFFVLFTAGVIYYFCFWYKANERATRMAIFSASIAVAGCALFCLDHSSFIFFRFLTISST